MPTTSLQKSEHASTCRRWSRRCVIESLGGQKVEQRGRRQCKSVIRSPAVLHAVTWRPAPTQPALYSQGGGGLSDTVASIDWNSSPLYSEVVWNGPGLMRTSMCVKTNPWASLHTSLLWARRARNEQTLPINLSNPSFFRLLFPLLRREREISSQSRLSDRWCSASEVSWHGGVLFDSNLGTNGSGKFEERL